MWLRITVVLCLLVSGRIAIADINKEYSAKGMGDNIERCSFEIASSTQFTIGARSWMQQHKALCSGVPGYEYFEVLDDDYPKFSGKNPEMPPQIKSAAMRAALLGNPKAVLLLLSTNLSTVEEIYIRSIGAKSGHQYSMLWLSDYYGEEGYWEEAVFWDAMFSCASDINLTLSHPERVEGSGKFKDKILNQDLLEFILAYQLGNIDIHSRDSIHREQIKKCVRILAR